MKHQAVQLSTNPWYEPVGCKAEFGLVHLGMYLLKRSSPSFEKGKGRTAGGEWDNFAYQ